MQDYSKLPEDLKAKLIKWEASSPTHKQVQLLSDIADISQEMLSALDDQKKGADDATKKFGAILVDMREQLSSLNAKEAPEIPDTSQPVIDAISKLEKALAVQKAPVVNVPKADAPVVNVDAPNVTVDNKEIAKILKTDLPKAFDEAIKGIVIPKTDTTATNQLLKDLSEKLSSIDTGVRMKPQAPTTMGITGVTLVNGKVPVDVDMATEGIATDTTIQDLDNKITYLLDRLEYGNITDKTKTLRVQLNPDLTHTISIAASQTLTTVSTVASVTNTVRQGDLQVLRVNEAILDTAFINGILNNVSF